MKILATWKTEGEWIANRPTDEQQFQRNRERLLPLLQRVKEIRANVTFQTPDGPNESEFVQYGQTMEISHISITPEDGNEFGDGCGPHHRDAGYATEYIWYEVGPEDIQSTDCLVIWFHAC